MSKILQNCLVLMPAQCLALMPALRPGNGPHEETGAWFNPESDIVVVPMEDIKNFATKTIELKDTRQMTDILACDSSKAGWTQTLSGAQPCLREISFDQGKTFKTVKTRQDLIGFFGQNLIGFFGPYQSAEAEALELGHCVVRVSVECKVNLFHSNNIKSIKVLEKESNTERNEDRPGHIANAVAADTSMEPVYSSDGKLTRMSGMS